MANSPQYHVRVTKDHLVFSAAHFITFNGNICERLHGHNWRLAVEVAGPLDENRYVFDFIALRDAAQKVVDELDHRVLLPTHHETIQVLSNCHQTNSSFVFSKTSKRLRMHSKASECVPAGPIGSEWV